jgi:transcriptional regulator with XRE-family HTH domain
MRSRLTHRRRPVRNLAQASSSRFSRALARRCSTAARVACGLSQRELAERSGVRQADISRIERGAGNPTESTLQPACRAGAAGSGSRPAFLRGQGLAGLPWSGGLAADVQDGFGDPGRGVAVCLLECLPGFGVAGAVPVPVGDVPGTPDGGEQSRGARGDRGGGQPRSRGALADAGDGGAAGGGEGQLAGAGCPARRPLRAGAAAWAASRTRPRTSSPASAQAASSCRTSSGDLERSIGPVEGPAPSRRLLVSRSPVFRPVPPPPAGGGEHPRRVRPRRLPHHRRRRNTAMT